MKQSPCKDIRNVLAVTLISSVSLLGTSAAWAQEAAANLKEQVVGTWMVTSHYVEQEGKKVRPFGSQPGGAFMFGRDGHFSNILIKSDLPKFAANNRMKGSAEENKSVVQGTIAYYGTYSVNDDGSVTFAIEGSTFPNWNGQKQKRFVTIKGDDMSVVNPTSAVGAGTIHVSLKRAK